MIIIFMYNHIYIFSVTIFIIYFLLYWNNLCPQSLALAPGWLAAHTLYGWASTEFGRVFLSAVTGQR